MDEKIKNIIQESIDTKVNLFDQTEQLKNIISIIIDSLKKGSKILIAGNGGSAADSQHFAGELVGRFKLERNALPAIALTTDSSILTSWSNDYCFEDVFSRQIEAYGKEGDIFIGISTSGNSENIIRAINQAKKQKIKTVSLLGNKGGKIKEISDISFIVNSSDTPRIQESHILIIHIICEFIEKILFNKLE